MSSISNKDLKILIKMENIIGSNENYLFGKKGFWLDTSKYTAEEYKIVTKDDFIDFMNIIEKICQSKDKAKMKAKERRKAK